MILLFLLFHLGQGPSTQAIPLSSPDSFLHGFEEPGRSLHDTTSVCYCPNPTQRSIWNILWSCLTVIFACSWVSVHPDIPAPGENRMRSTFRRVEYLVWTLLAPELIVFWAGRQFLGARYIAKTLEQHGWTKVHAHFLQMGGFLLVDSDGKTSKGVLSYTQFWKLLYQNRINLPKITEEEIKDRGKSDGLGKLLVILQTGWFILQCLSRKVQGLDLTELELATLAFASLNGWMYFFWWDKPFDVHIPVRVPLLPPAPCSSDKDRGPGKSDKPPNFVNVNGGATPRSNKFRDQIIHVPSKAYQFICRRMRALLSLYISAKRYTDEAPTTSDSEPAIMHLPAFHAFMLDGDDHTDGYLILGLPLIASAFGAIHCAAWSFHFPSVIEHQIWRISSVSISSIPLVDLTLLVVISNITSQGPLSTFFRNLLQTIMVYVSLPVYFAARLALLIETLTTLREVPHEAFADVKWTSFIPHIA